jgi:hypothetical protein
LSETMGSGRVTKLILSEMYGTLKPRGYRKRGQLFEKGAAEVVHLVGLQKSLSSTAQAVKVTVNLAIWLKSLAPVRAGIPDKPNIWAAHCMYRIGSLSPEKQDHWWWVTNESEAQAAAQVICSWLRLYALPVIEAVQTETDLLALWRQGICPGLSEFQMKNYLAKVEGRG